MALRDITGQFIPAPDQADRLWCPQYQEETGHMFVANNQRRDESLLDFYERRGIAEGINDGVSSYADFRNRLVIGTSDITRDFVIVIGCPTAAIISRISSAHGRDDATVGNDVWLEANAFAAETVAEIDEMLQECRDIGHFTDPTQIQSVIIGQFDPANSGRIEQSVNRILKEGMQDMGLNPMEYQYHESPGDIQERPGLGTITVLAPAITGAPMPHILIDDELEFSLTP